MRSWRSVAPSGATSRASASPFQAETPTSPAKSRSTARTAATLASFAGKLEHRGDGDATICARALRQALGDFAVEAKRLGEDERPVAADAPAIEETAGADGFAHRRAAKYDGFGEDEIGVLGEIDVDAAPQPHLIEENGLLRQPCERAAGADRKLDPDFRIRTERAVDLFRGGGCDGQSRAGADGNVDIEAVAAGHSSGGIDHHRIERAVALAIRKAHPQRPGLMHARAASAAMSGDDRALKAPARAIAGEHLMT